MRDTKRPIAGALLAVGGIVIAAGAVWASAPGALTISKLSGRWSGSGTVVPASGPQESFSCVATYKPSNGGAKVKQNLRCKSRSFKLDAATNLVISGKRVTGHWHENTHSLNGTVSGVVTPAGFNVMLNSTFFSAKMRVSGTGCVQSLNVRPAKNDKFRQMSAALKRC